MRDGTRLQPVRFPAWNGAAVAVFVLEGTGSGRLIYHYSDNGAEHVYKGPAVEVARSRLGDSPAAVGLDGVGSIRYRRHLQHGEGGLRRRDRRREGVPVPDTPRDMPILRRGDRGGRTPLAGHSRTTADFEFSGNKRPVLRPGRDRRARPSWTTTSSRSSASRTSERRHRGSWLG